VKKTTPLALHVVAGIPVPAPPKARTSVLRLPGGPTTTRWLSRGASQTAGWGAALERELNQDLEIAAHCVLDLTVAGMDLEELTDELHPLWDRGLPRILAAMDESRVQLAALGALACPGTFLLDLAASPSADRLKKLSTWCRKNDLGLLVRCQAGMDGSWKGRTVAADASIADLAGHFLPESGIV